MSQWSLYIIRTISGDLYTGITTDVDRRFAEHQAGGKKSSRYLRGRGPLQLVYIQPIGTRSQALRAEAVVKKLPKLTKEKLLSGALTLDQLLASNTH